MLVLLAPSGTGVRCELGQDTRRQVRIEDVEMRVRSQSPVQIGARLRCLTETMPNRAGVEKQPCVLRAQLQRLLHGRAGLLRLATFVQGPGEQIIGVDILPHF